MCGRFTLTASPERVQEVLELHDVSALEQPRYNVAPTQPVAVVTDGEERRVEMFRWGLVPSWADDPAIGSRLINARAETAAEKPAFRAAFARRRCLVLADGFYEWQKEGTRKQPYHIRLASGEPFAFAGLWEVWRPSEEAEPLLTCTILTGDANELVAPIHDRSPVILPADARWRWLDPDASREELRAFLRPFPAERMEAYPISTLVNSPANDGPELLAG